MWRLGGIDEYRNLIEVEIDKSYFIPRKYNRDALHDRNVGVWRSWTRQSEMLMRIFKDRRKETLEDFIAKWILSGTRILSDDWPSYTDIESINRGIYTHDVITHKDNFFGEYNQSIHTQNTENFIIKITS